MRFLALRSFWFVFLLTFCLHFPARAALPADDKNSARVNQTTDANIARIEGDMLQNFQYLQHPFDQEISGRFLDRYIESWDYSHLFFIQSDIDEFNRYRTNLNILTMVDHDMSPCWTIFSRFMERVKERVSYVSNMVATTPFEFSGHERFVLNRHTLPYPINMTEAQQFWRQEVRSEYLDQLLSAQGIEFTATLHLQTNKTGTISGNATFVSDKAHPLDFEHFPKSILDEKGKGLGTVTPDTNGTNVSIQLNWPAGFNFDKTTNGLYAKKGKRIGDLHFRRETMLFYHPTGTNSTNLATAALDTFHAATNIAVVIHLDETNLASIAKTLTTHYTQILDNYKDLENDRIFEVYMNALAHAYDPHSDYMGHLQAENFAITMKLSLFGIGAVLEKDQSYCKIRELKEGPAKKSGKISEGDRIVAVAQGNPQSTGTLVTPVLAPSSDAPPPKVESVDVVGMPLEKIVELIRGAKGTQVTLTIIPADAPDSTRKEVTLVRDEIKLEEQAAKARFYEISQGKKPALKIGVIDLLSFYADSNHPEKNTTTDVMRLIDRMKKEKVDGIILDLRRNGGGYLEEAIKLTGLFNPKGPVVQTRDPSGEIFPDTSPEPGPFYDGPLVLLTSVFSASASEILAGALQDYGRAVIVGDHATFGKGTVQTMDRLAPRLEQGNLKYSYDPGELKITIKKFYRAGGLSTQLQGVLSDINLPSIDDYADVGEHSLPNAMPYDAVTSADHLEELILNRVKPYLPELQSRSSQRLTKDKDFTYIQEDITRFRKDLADKSVSLNKVEREVEFKKDLARAEARKKERAHRKKLDEKVFDINLQNVDLAALQPSAVKTNGASSHIDLEMDGDDEEGVAAAAGIDPTLDETKRILRDYIELLGKNVAISQTASH